MQNTKEHKRLQEGKDLPVFPWHKWGPYVAERAWGIVREDYSENGDAWNFFNFDMAVSKVPRWGEDGIAGICDRFQELSLTFAFWNKKDRLLKERLFGLNPYEGNHGEDVKECYYHLDNTPTHSYMKYLYKYPQEAFPYERLREENKRRNRNDLEFELSDTDIFKGDRYFDIAIEYGKNTPEDIVIKLEVFNRGDQDSVIDLLPQLVFRKNFDSFPKKDINGSIQIQKESKECSVLVCDDSKRDPIEVLPFKYAIGKRYFYGKGEAIFTDNETNNRLLYNVDNVSSHVKDAFQRYIVFSEKEAINPEKKGTKAALYLKDQMIPAKGSKVFLFRFSDTLLQDPFSDIEKILAKRKKEADEFYEAIHPKNASLEEKEIQRKALSGMLWSKQLYYFDVAKWLKGDDPERGLSRQREEIRNKHWKHLLSMRILSMPDKWEYPWFAAWDLAFHTLSFALVDMEFAKEQLWLLLFDQFQHPNGQIPAYEWNFSEMNPPVQGFAALRLFQMEYKKTGKKDYSFLKKCFHKLIINFAWWVNKVDAKGNNVFEGGFLGLDNITIFDRSAAIPGGGVLEQSDGTGWMGMFCLALMRMAIELSSIDKDYEPLATKFFEHYVYIGAALHKCESREIQIWNEQDGFFYDVISFPDGSHSQISVRSLVGIIPLFALDFVSEEELERLPSFKQSFFWFLQHRKDLVDLCVTPFTKNGKKSYLLALMKGSQIKRVLNRIWDPNEFRSKYGMRSLSKVYQQNPYALLGSSISYEPGEAHSFLKGGNSNWRGPIWFPANFLFIESLKKIDSEMGSDFFIEADGKKVTAKEIASYFANGLISLFKKEEGKRPIYTENTFIQNNPHFNEHILFYEHFHADTGRGLGASHQTGWTALVSNLIDEWI